jgi:sulfite exporter TauE/SafE
LAALVVAAIQPSCMVPTALASALHGHSHSPAVTAGRSIFKSEFLGSAWTGFLAGCLHTLSGPDHLAALAPLSIGRSPVESAAVGALWGCGHDAGQVMFGLLFLGLKDRLHIEILRTWGTRVVGLTLMVIGAIGIREATQAAPCVAAALDGAAGGPHQHGGNSLEKALMSGGGKKKEISFATFATGIVHGLQPDALMIILPALAMPSRAAGAAFLGMFLVGTVMSMASYTVLIGTCTEALRERVPRITEKLTWAASLVAISMGIAIIVSESFGVSLY